MPITLAEARSRWAHLPAGLREHLERVSHGAHRLAQRWDVDPETAALAGFLHDVARAQSPELLLEQAKELGIAINPMEEAMPLLLHGPVAAALLQLEQEDEGVVNAVRWHTTGRWEMSALEQVVFLADKTDPNKINGSPGMQKVAQLGETSLNLAVVRYLERSTKRLLKQGRMLHPASIEARNWLLLQGANSEEQVESS